MAEGTLAAIKERFSCKEFDTQKPLSEDEENTILAAGRLAPSSLGLEHWKFVVVEDKQKKEALRKSCWNQPQITTAPFVVVIVGRIKDLEPGSPHVASRLLALLEGDKKGFNDLLKFYSEYHNSLDIRRWSSENCHLAAMNMMNAAKSIGIDSCPIGGFEENGVKEALGVDDDFLISLILPFGRCAKEGREKERLPFESVVQRI